ncbi:MULTISPECIES: hypothetical protein [Proteus]|uniref:hypothetical protein n=1 Tax=Proteus TaxID=583 RepID=UPI0018E88853|nr:MULTISPECIES: hypothetical protein [Proteus]MBJ2108361.1 hypothetical protein [Proteus terrae]MBJ2132233.1 hypothetical protein [Proteus terrae]
MSEDIRPSLGDIAQGQDVNREEIHPSLEQSIRIGSVSGASVQGTIEKQIGTGEKARESFVWTTLKFCFYLGAGCSILMFVAYYYFIFFSETPDKLDIVIVLKDIWSIFTPILTLALGYAFGRKGDSE